MVTGRSIVLVLILAVLAGGAIIILKKPSDEQLIKKQLTTLAEQVAKETGEPAMQTLTKAGKVADLFSDVSLLKIDNPVLEERLHRRDVMNKISMARNLFVRLTVKFYDINIIISSPHQADVVLTMRLVGQRHGEMYTDTQEVNFVFLKQGKTWLISEVHLVEILEK